MSFKWFRAIDRDCPLSSKKSVSSFSGAYERLCTLFNVAALQSQLADGQNRSSDDGLKQASKLFQVLYFFIWYLFPTWHSIDSSCALKFA